MPTDWLPWPGKMKAVTDMQETVHVQRRRIAPTLRAVNRKEESSPFLKKRTKKLLPPGSSTASRLQQ
jgi:hypothetical protein